MVISILILHTTLQGQTEKSSTGITFRFGFWNMGNESNFLKYRAHDGYEHIETGGAGGSLTFFSRTSDVWEFELNLGGFGKVNSDFGSFADNEDVTAVIPVLFGARRDFLHINNSSALRPYVSFGGGPYWITNVQTKDNFNTEEVISSIKPGGYAGGGLNFFFSQKVALNLDLKYHFVDFNTKNEISGLEVGLGFSIMWGKYESQNK